MESDICRSCRRSLDETNENNIFQKEILIKSIDLQSINNKKWSMKVSSAIELITGQKVLQEMKLPRKLCQVCLQNVEAFVNFRIQLIRSEEILLQLGYSDSKETIDNKCRETQNVPPLHPSISVSNVNNIIEKSENNDNLTKNESSNRLSILKPNDERTPKSVPEDLINVDDSSVSLDINSHDYDKGTNAFLISKLENDQENNNHNDSDNSANNPEHRNEDIAIKQIDHDIESEIDVCSGEDDEVLELDVQKQRNETVEINSSSESDIEVCDYEPVGKKANYNTFSPPVRY
ncbi:putative uncharacterized protein DDB_G0285495 isoform X2 [Phymastichus coffea]|uniref:putative uncharacterized protein DDB_G0285495 isoform X2 n=1 Tax=Phymastichus coffea TaxID=108790 RepID=UPI00273ABF0E|nr:putative uncharacterized protein DDB_G0285495 isoform X2 [Phymastichus coffea]